MRLQQTNQHFRANAFRRLGIQVTLVGLASASSAIDPQYQWQNITNTTAFAGRDGAGAVVYNDKMWLLGGWNPSNATYFPKITSNDVWNSTNGATWNLVKPNTYADGVYNPATDWEGRHTAGYAVYNNKMWIIGGDANQGHYQNDVWNSSDGVNWTNVNASNPVPWGPRVLHYTTVHDGKIWVMGGQTLPQFAPAAETFYNDIWNSTDGINWTQVQTQGPSWTKHGAIGGSVEFNGKMWILGGGTYWTPNTGEELHNDVWSSADGVHWTQNLATAPWAARKYHSVAVFDGRMWVMGGSNLGDRKDVWYSNDGVNWTELGGTPWLERHAASLFVYNNALWITAGDRMTTDVWKLTRTNPGVNQWKANVSGDWNTTANWTESVPNAIDASASLMGAIASPQTIFTNTGVTLGALHFDNTSSYQIVGQGSLTMQVSTGSAVLDVLHGSQKINLPVFIASNTTVSVAIGATLTIADPVTIRANKMLTRSGNVIIQAPLIIETGGILSVGPGPAAALAGAPSLASGARVDVQSNALTIDYHNQASPSSIIQAQLTSGFNGGVWDGAGINTSSATAATGLGWKDNPASQSILVNYTYYGDVDLNGAVDSSDFNALAANYGAIAGAVWSSGDFNYDGKINSVDFNSLAGNFGLSIPAPTVLGTMVPEPSCLLMLALLSAGSLMRLPRRKQAVMRVPGCFSEIAHSEE